MTLKKGLLKKSCQNFFKVKEKQGKKPQKVKRKRKNVIYLVYELLKDRNANKWNRLLRLLMQEHSNGTCICMKIIFLAAEKFFPNFQVIRISFFFLSFFFLNYLFTFGCVGSSFLCEGFLQLRQAGATLHRSAWVSHYHGLSCCGAQAPDAQAQ